MERTGSMMSLI